MQRIVQPGLVLVASLLAMPAHAANVTAVYEGPIDADSGLGLVGQTMHVEIVYDDAVTGTPSGNGMLYEGFIVSASVTVGANVWTWNGPYSSMFLYNDDILGTVPEDRINLDADAFTGPDLGTGPITFGPALSISLADLVPNGAPDALATDASLPPVAPDPALFDDTGVLQNDLTLRWFGGEFGEDTRFFSASNFTRVEVQAEPQQVPVPAAALAALAVLLAGARVRRYRG